MSIFKLLKFLKDIRDNGHSDADLIQTYRNGGDLDVLGVLYSRYIDLVYGVCLKYFENTDNAQDGVMAIFEELIPKVRKHEILNFRSWLYTVAKHHCLMQLRSGKKQVYVKLDADNMQLEQDEHLKGLMEREDQLRRLEGCIQRLAEEQRKAITLFYLERKCYQEIAEITGIEWNKVRSYIQNGRRNLKICMEQQPSQQVMK